MKVKGLIERLTDMEYEEIKKEASERAKEYFKQKNSQYGYEMGFLDGYIRYSLHNKEEDTNLSFFKLTAEEVEIVFNNLEYLLMLQDIKLTNGISSEEYKGIENLLTRIKQWQDEHRN